RRRGASIARWASTRRCWSPATTAAAKAARKVRCACCACCAPPVRSPRPGVRRGWKTRSASFSGNDRQADPDLRRAPHVVIQDALPVAVEELEVEVAAHRPYFQVARAAREIHFQAAFSGRPHARDG